MKEFCGGEALWNTSLTWGNDRLYPGFTECFQNTVLVWVPSGWLFLASVVYFPYLLYQPSKVLLRTKKNRLKLVIAVLQMIVLIVELSHRAYELNRKQETYWQASFVGPLIEAVTMVLVAVYIELERRKGIVTSGVLFIYWVIANIGYVIPFYLRLIEKEYETFLLGFVMSNIYFLMSVAQLVLSCLAEEVPVTTRKKPCPESSASFFSRLFFQWIQSLVVTGYRQPLAEDDMFSLKVEDQSKTLVVPFEQNWLKEEIKLQIRKGINRTRDQTYSVQFEPVASESYNEFSERTPLLKNHSKVNAQSESSDEKKNKVGVSLYKVLFKTFGFELFRSNLPKFFYDVLLFVNPFLLRQLIDFTEDTTQPTWKGYVYSVGFFAVSVLQGLLMHNMYHQSMTLGIKLRSTLISAIFKKSLRLSNQARTESTSGEIMNLMSVDAQNIKDLCEYMWCLWSGPLQIIVCVILLYYTVGFAMFAGLGVMLLLTPVNLITTSKVQTYQKTMMEFKDSRIKLMTEILNGIKILKLYAWEMAFGEKITLIRGKELAMMYKEQMMYSISTLSWTVAPFTVGLATFATYIFTKEDHRFDPQSIFVAIVLFNILRFAMNVAPELFMELVMCWVSVARIQAYLNKADIDTSNVTHLSDSKNAVSIMDGTFLWDKEIGPALKRINLQIPKGSLVAIVGSVGSGKSSLVSAMLGEMEKVGGTVNVDGSTAYVAQQAWIQNASVKNNILFGNDFQESRYDDVVEACALKADIDMLPAGDLTEIGEKGINLSGGQKQRVSLARAVYFDSDIYILDDPLSAVDAHVGKHIFEHVIGKNGVLKDKTRVLVTHGIHWLPHVDTIVVVTNGEISETGSYEALLGHDGAFSKFLKTYLIEHQEELEAAEEEDAVLKQDIFHRLVSIQPDVDHSEANTLTEKLIHWRKSHRESDKSTTDVRRLTSQGDKMIQYSAQTSPVPSENIDAARLIEEEEVEIGRVQWKVYMQYARALGLKYAVCLVVLYAIYQSLYIWSAIWLTYWTADPQLQNLTLYPANSTARRELNNYYLTIYGEFGIAQAIAVLIYSLVQAFCVIEAAKVLHQKLLVNVLRGPMSFFDTTPVGRIVNRFSQDIEAVDSTLPEKIVEVLWSFYAVISVFVVVAYSTPIFLTVILPLGFLYFIMQVCSLQHLNIPDSDSTPGISLFHHAAFLYTYVTTAQTVGDKDSVTNLQQFPGKFGRWLGIRLDIMGGVVVLAASLFSVLERGNISSAIVGLSVSYALQITEILAWFVRMVSEFETNIVSVERIGQYTANKTEAPLHSDVQLPVDWPSEGSIELRSYCTRYRDGLPLVLQNLHVKFKPGEKVGIVGRTGAGKSSLTLALFRLIEAAEGSIVIDGEDISRLGLHDLRSRLTILPQEPVLFSGSLRMNLDPLGAHNDDDLWASLDHAHLKTFIEGLPGQLEYEVGEGGQNLSVGQRQLICLARSLLRKMKILVLDEATAAVDLETDSLIQDTISSEFGDCTVLTIAHRLNTVMEYDKILVLSDGRILEYDRPQTLLADSNSAFYAMAKDAGLVSCE
ncbi:multidrug resistance-associated protein 1-like isoform X2 [Dreissena polymorpha]|uniref:multidrug resistance-associated protein 1-like isoform X2 n=1 Tax=Dreissena polymorpha TaxID=45954 RepID=UPI0022646F9C|nr:multidrug resistance-associated protein 1-like isoform X2 [Dreissena polymorpha]